MSFPTIELRVVDVRTAVPAGAGVEAGMVALQEGEAPWRILRMIIGQPEARAIHSRWKGMAPPRPSTWDLYISTLGLLDAELRQVVITAVEEERHYFATLELSVDGAPRVLPCRPSDAVALAMRVRGSKIMTYEDVMSAAGVLTDGSRSAPAPPEAAAKGGVGTDVETGAEVGAAEVGAGVEGEDGEMSAVETAD